jgi:hypothetical protein
MMEGPLLTAPLQLDRRFVVRSWLGGILTLAVGLAATIGFTAWQIGAARDIVRDEQVWSRGLVAEDVRVSGHETSRHFVLNTYELTATFTTRDGQPRSENLSFDTFLYSVDSGAPLEARYDPADPSRVVVSWEVNASGGRWAAVLFMVAGGLLVAGAFLVLGIRTLGRLSVARRVTAGFEELEVTVVRVVEIRAHGRATGVHQYEFVVPDEQRGSGKRLRKHSVTFNHKKGHTPIVLSQDKRRILAVRPTAGRAVPVVLRHDGYPFTLSETARATLTAAAARRYDRDADSGKS